jgi:hypothetical protein
MRRVGLMITRTARGRECWAFVGFPFYEALAGVSYVEGGIGYSVRGPASGTGTLVRREGYGKAYRIGEIHCETYCEEYDWQPYSVRITIVDDQRNNLPIGKDHSRKSGRIVKTGHMTVVQSLRHAQRA